MTRVLVTGANGFVGRPCVSRLLEAGYEVHAVSRRPPPWPKVTWHQGDLLRPGVARELVRAIRPSHLLALAWCTEPGVYWTSPENAQWLTSGIELAEAFVAAGGRRAVFTGSCAEYDWRHGLCSEELTPKAPATPYGRCKLALSEALAPLFTGVSWSWARLFFLYGPFEPSQRLIPSVIRALLAETEIACTDGRQQRDFLYVDDAAEALVRLLGREHRGPINVASGRAVAVREVAERIGEKLKAAHLIRFGARNAVEEPVVLADTRALFSALEWQPSFTLSQGLDSTIDWWRKHP